MDDLLQRFLSGQSVTRKVIAGGTTDGRIATEYERPNYTEDEVPDATTRYARQFTNKIRDEVWQVSEKQTKKQIKHKILIDSNRSEIRYSTKCATRQARRKWYLPEIRI